MDVHSVIMRSRPAAVQAAKDAAAELRGEPLGPRRVKARQDAGVAVRLFKRLRKVNAPGEKLKFFFLMRFLEKGSVDGGALAIRCLSSLQGWRRRPQRCSS